MPTTKEFSIQMADRPGLLGQTCRALAERGVNILAFQSIPFDRKSLLRIVVDSPTTAKAVLDEQGLLYTEADVVQLRIRHKPGALGRASSLLGEANININYAYAGIDLSANAPLLIFGVSDVVRAASILDQATDAAA
jgi:hypothetical protein